MKKHKTLEELEFVKKSEYHYEKSSYGDYCKIYLTFDESYKSFTIYEINKSEMKFPVEFSMEYYIAINMKLKELGWLDEDTTN